MKKRLLFGVLLVMLVGGFVNGQGLPIDPETKKITYQETVIIDTVDREELYVRSKDWISNFYKTDKYSPDDKANYKIGKEASFDVQLTYDFKYKSHNNVSYTIVIAQKEGKYRYTITDFRVYNVKSGEKTVQSLEVAMSKMSGQNKTETITQVNKSVADIIADMKRYISTGKPENKEDW